MLFSKIYYINLKRRPDRDKNVKDQINKINLSHLLERVDGVDGKLLNIENISDCLVTKKGKDDALNKKKEVYVPLTRGAIGCALSHLNIYKKIINENIDSALILEDDIRINDDFLNKLMIFSKKIRKMPVNFEILFLGYHDSTIKYLKQYNDLFYIPTRIYGLFGYIVTNKAAKKLLNVFPIELQIDSEMGKHFNHDLNNYEPHKIIAFAVNPLIRSILSDSSSVKTKYGTDIQIRENFMGVDSKNLIEYIFLFFILIVLVYLLMIPLKFKLHT